MSLNVAVEIVGPPLSGSDEPRRLTAHFSHDGDELPSDDDLRIAIAQTKVAHGFFARVEGDPAAAVIEEINVRITDAEEGT